MRVILHAEQRPKQHHKDENLQALPQEPYLLGKENIHFFDCMVSKKLIHLLRHGSLHRVIDGAIEFWKIKDKLEKHFLYCHHWSDDKWKKSMGSGGVNKKRYQYCTDSSWIILYLRALQGHSGRNLIYRTMLLFRAASSSAFVILDVQSVDTPSQFQDWYREDNLSKRHTFFFVCGSCVTRVWVRGLWACAVHAQLRARVLLQVWTPRVTRHIFLTCLHAHAWLKSRVCRASITWHESSPCAHVFLLTLFDYSIFLSLLTFFSLIILTFLLPINFVFQDVVDKFFVHSRWGPWQPCPVRPSHTWSSGSRSAIVYQFFMNS